MTTDTNPYGAYTVDTVLNSNPLGLVVALYEGAIDASATARKFMASGDILARTRGINKLVSILTELISSLNYEQGGEVSKNLGQLYSYMQRRVIEAHLQKTAAPLEEVEKLLTTMLEGWKEAGSNLALENQSVSHHHSGSRHDHTGTGHDHEFEHAPYGGYMAQHADLFSRQAYSF